jgi:hypothetical protein
MVIEKKRDYTKVFKQINIRIIPRGLMRPQYQDGFDYFLDEKGALQIRIAEFENPDFAFYWAMHEAMEAWRCFRDGVSLESIEKWDAKHADDDDPGALPGSPYRKQHLQSMTIQHMLCEQDGYIYEEYMEAEPLPLPKEGAKQ